MSSPDGIGAQSRPRTSQSILAKKVDDDLVLLNPHSGEYFTLDEIGSRVWELCDGTRTVSEIAATLAQEYAAPAEDIEADITELLKDLADGHLMEITNR